jgi:rhodanese-related sulfurtransferase
MDTVSTRPQDLYAQLGGSHAPCILDVRRDAAYERDDRLIAGALRPTAGLADFAAKHAHGRPVVVYCVHGHEVSQEAAAALAAKGMSATYLEGGIEAWRSAGLPTIRRRAEWHVPGGSRWITRARPKIDRIACPWLIRRFIDPLAELAYVPASEVLGQAKARDAVAFDIPGAPVHHRGERCSFDALIEDFDLHDAALDRLATIVRGADTDRLDLSPESSELLAASMELSRRHADDHEMLAQAMPLYDALYARCRG